MCARVCGSKPWFYTQKLSLEIYLHALKSSFRFVSDAKITDLVMSTHTHTQTYDAAVKIWFKYVCVFLLHYWLTVG